MMKVFLSRPDITKKEKEAVLKVLNTPYLSSGSVITGSPILSKVREFEARVAEYAGVGHGVAVSSGTAALHLIIRALGIGDGDEVITTPFSFISSSNCVLFERAKPVFADIEPLTLNIDTDLIEEKITKRTKAILAVDIFGHPARWDKLESLAKKHGLRLIDDSCEALGSEYKGQKAGTFGDAGAFAFYPNKQITTGEGAVIVTDNKELARLCVSMRNQGRDPAAGHNWLEHVRLGYNYRLSDINCALGITQMKRLEGILSKRAKVAEMYDSRLKDIDEIELPRVSSDVKMSWFVYVVRLRSGFTREKRDRILGGLRKKGIECSNYFPPIHLQPFYRRMFGYKKGDYPITESVSERTIALPFYNNLGKDGIDYVVKRLKKEVALKED